MLADEINRAPAKVQAALLEAMEERQVTVAGTTHKMPPLFMVMATQNPVEQEGTYPLPEAQMDRFLMHVNIVYPPVEDEVKIIDLVRGEEIAVQDDSPREDPPARIPQQAVFEFMKGDTQFNLPSISFLDDPEERPPSTNESNLRMQSRLLEKKLEDAKDVPPPDESDDDSDDGKSDGG